MDLAGEYILECFVRYPEKLDAATRQDVIQHLEHDALAREIVCFYRKFYELLDTLDTGAIAKIEAFVDRLFVPDADEASHSSGT